MRKKDHTIRQPHRISKHLLALSTSSRLSEHASPTRFNNGVRVGWCCNSTYWQEKKNVDRENVDGQKCQCHQHRNRKRTDPFHKCCMSSISRHLVSVCLFKFVRCRGVVVWCLMELLLFLCLFFPATPLCHRFSPWQNMKCHLSHVQCGQNMEYHLVRSTLSKM